MGGHRLDDLRQRFDDHVLRAADQGDDRVGVGLNPLDEVGVECENAAVVARDHDHGDVRPWLFVKAASIRDLRSLPIGRPDPMLRVSWLAEGPRGAGGQAPRGAGAAGPRGASRRIPGAAAAPYRVQGPGPDHALGMSRWWRDRPTVLEGPTRRWRPWTRTRPTPGRRGRSW